MDGATVVMIYVFLGAALLLALLVRADEDDMRVPYMPLVIAGAALLWPLAILFALLVPLPEDR